jgi:uncharacterized protein YkwD
MRKPKLFNFGLAIVSTFLFLTTPTIVSADTLILPGQYDLPAGLTFLYGPPKSAQEVGLDELLATISFPLSEALLVGNETSSDNLTDLIVPVVKAEEATENAVAEESPTPVLTVKAATKEALATVIVSPSPKVTTKPTGKPSAKPKESAVAKPIASPTPKAVSSNTGGLNADRLFDMANNYRATKGLPAFQKDSRVCELAVSRAPEITQEIANGHMHSGLRARNLPYWNSENIISMNSEEAAFNWWISDRIHREAIESDKIYSCVACSSNACAQEFTSFTPK